MCDYCDAPGDVEPLEIATYVTGATRIRCIDGNGCDHREKAVMPDEARDD